MRRFYACRRIDRRGIVGLVGEGGIRQRLGRAQPCGKTSGVVVAAEVGAVAVAGVEVVVVAWKTYCCSYGALDL